MPGMPEARAVAITLGTAGKCIHVSERLAQSEVLAVLLVPKQGFADLNFIKPDYACPDASCLSGTSESKHRGAQSVPYLQRSDGVHCT